jgi:hypothetical protein
MDGTVTIQPPPTSVAVLRSDDDKIIFQGQVATELARQGASLQLLDETVSLGSYEVEILLLVGSVMPPLTVAKRPSHCQNIRRKSRGVNTSRVGPHQNNKIPSRCLTPITANIPSISQNVLATKRRSLLNRKPPPQPKKTKREIEAAWSCDDKVSVATSMTTSTQTTSDCVLPDSLPREPYPFLQQPHKGTSATLGKYAKALSHVSPSTTTLSNSSSSMKSPATNNFFPGAVGNPDVPHCIKKVLQPHQIEGVAFLWNCLTGHGKVAQMSSHCISHDDGEDDQVTYRGCILGDGTFIAFELLC